MSIDKFRLDWRNSPQKQFDAMVQMVVYLQGMLNKLTDIDVKLNALTAISNLVSTQTQAILQLGDRVENMQTVLNTIADLEKAQSLLLQAVSDNTSCACNTLQNVVQKQNEQNSKLDTIIDILENPVTPGAIYEFKLTTVSHELTNTDLTNQYFDLSGISSKDGQSFPGVKIIDCPDWLNPVIEYPDSTTFRLKLVAGVPLPIGEIQISLKQIESNTIQAFTFSYYDYIELNGIKWAKGNLIADVSDATGMTSKLSQRMDVFGDYYQWGRKKAWIPGNVAGWDKNPFSGIVWPIDSLPCPEGWRLPTEAEFNTLVALSSTFRAVGMAGNAVAGRFIGVNHATATIDNLKGCLFIPASGRLSSSTGILGDYNNVAFYWSSVPSGENSRILTFNSSNTFSVTNSARSYGLPIRLVKGTVPVHSLTYEFNGGYPSSGTAPGNYQQGETIYLPSMDKVGFTFNGFLSSAWTGYKQPGDTFIMPPIDTLVIADWSEILSDSIDVTNTLSEDIHVIILPKGQQPNWSDDIRYYFSGGDTLDISESSDGEHLQEGISYTLFYNQDGVLGEFDFIFHGGDSYNIPV